MKFFAHKSQGGFSLIEVMIALIIITLVILGGGMFFFYGRVNIIREAHRRAALLVVSQRLEALKAKAYNEINIGSDTEPVDVDNLLKGSGPTMVTEAEYVDDPAGGSSEDYKQVTVTVEWSDSTTNTVSLITFIAPR